MENENQTCQPDDSVLLKEIENSNNTVSRLLNDCTDMVLNVQTANDMRETKRRNEEQRLKLSRTAFLKEEVRKTEAQFNEKLSKWDSISKLNDSVDVYNAVENQKNKYKTLIQQKNNIINDLKKELAATDRRFMEDQETQEEDIEVLSNRINEHIKVMKQAYNKHLEFIKDTAEKQCKMRLYGKHEEWLRIYNIFKQEGVDKLNETFTTVHDFEKQVIQMIWEHYEQYRIMKKNMDLELQDLHISLEKTKASCLIDEKKLEYNYLVLNKRQKELVQIKTKQRRQINSLQEELNSLEIKNKKFEQEHQYTCKKLVNEISKLEITSKELLDKKEHIDAVNENVFKQVWKLNEKRAHKCINKILNIDKQIHEQILHTEWKPPTLSFIKVTELPSIQLAIRHDAEFQKSDVKEKSTEISMEDCQWMFPNLDTIKFILQNISDNIEFIISDKIDILTENLPTSKRSLVCFDNILKLLQIKNKWELQMLKDQFIPTIKCLTCSNRTHSPSKKFVFPYITKSKCDRITALSQRANSGNKLKTKTMTTDLKRPASTPGQRKDLEVFSKKRNYTGRGQDSSRGITAYSDSSLSNSQTICDDPKHLWYLDKLTVIRILSEYIENRKQRRKLEKPLGIQKVSLSSILSLKDMELYWNTFRFKSIDNINNTWEVTLSGLNSRYQLLKDLKVHREEIKLIEKQNVELKQVLKNFMERVAGGEKQLSER